MADRSVAGVARGRLEVLAAGVLWSLGGVFVRSLALPAAVIAASRSLFAAAALLPFARRRPTRSPALLLGSIATYTAVVGLFVWSTKVTSAANAIILQYTAPAFVFLLDWLLLGERPERRNLLTLLGGAAGILVIWLGSEPGDALGIGLAVTSGVLFAAWIVIARAGRDVDAVALTAANNLGAALLLLPLAAGAGLPGARQAVALAVMGTVQLALPYVLFTRGVRRVGAQEASLLVLVEPVLNPVWVALVVGERPAPATIAGGAIILVTLALRYSLPARRDGARGASPGAPARPPG